MKAHVDIGGTSEFHLEKAILVYSRQTLTGSTTFALQCPVDRRRKGPPRLGAAELVSISFLQKLAEELGASLKPEVLPGNVVCSTPHVIAWWTPLQVRPLFFRAQSELGSVSGRHFALPALLWKLSGNEMWVRALKNSERPTTETPVYRAPFWNTDPEGLVCQGSMRRPESINAAALQDWVESFFAAEFTHVYDQFGRGGQTSHEGGVIQLWRSLAGTRRRTKAFPVESLVAAGETAQKFIERGGIVA